MPSTFDDSGTGLYRCNRRATKQNADMKHLKQKEREENQAWLSLKNLPFKKEKEHD